MNNFPLLLGTVCSLLAMVTDSISASRKTASGVLLVQNISQLFYGIGSILLKGYSGAVQNAVSIIRNFVAIRKIDSKVLEWFLVALGVVLGLAFNNLGAVGYLPVIANLQYTLAVFRFRDNERALKLSFQVTVAMFALFNLFIYNFVGFATNTTVLITSLIVIFKQQKPGKSPKRKKAAKAG